MVDHFRGTSSSGQTKIVEGQKGRGNLKERRRRKCVESSPIGKQQRARVFFGHKSLHGPLIKARTVVGWQVQCLVVGQPRRIFTPTIRTHPFFFFFFASSAWATPFTPFGHRLRRLHSICQVIFHRRLYLTGRAFTWTTIFQRCNTHHVHSVWTLVRREGYHQLERSSDVKWKNHRAILTAKTRAPCIE